MGGGGLCSQATGRNETKRMIRQIRCSIGMSGDRNPGFLYRVTPTYSQVLYYTVLFPFPNLFCGEFQTFQHSIFLNIELFEKHRQVWWFFCVVGLLVGQEFLKRMASQNCQLVDTWTKIDPLKKKHLRLITVITFDLRKV